MSTPDVEELKKQAAHQAVTHVRSGMVLGLGTGSTTTYAVHRIGELWQAGELQDIRGVPTSVATERLAQEYTIPLVDLKSISQVDLAIDGADEVAPNLDLIKGLGGALLREKRVEELAKRFIVIVDETKLVARLGTRSPLPVEVTQTAATKLASELAQYCARVEQRKSSSGELFVTDNGNGICDLYFDRDGIAEPRQLSQALSQTAGVCEHGLFLGMATEAIVASAKGIRVLNR